MLDILGSYKSSVFGNMSDIMPSPNITSKILKLFSDNDFLPSTFQEISPLSGPQTRLNLMSQNNEWSIGFGFNRIYIQQQPIDPKGKNLGKINVFTDKACEFIERILKEFNRKGNRISLISSGFLKEMPDKKLSEIYNKLFNSITFYTTTPPFEWNSRAAARVSLEGSGLSEQLNVITKINRVWGYQQKAKETIPFDRIEIGFDINTIHENQETRFDIDSIRTFYTEAISLQEIILSDLEVFLNG